MALKRDKGSLWISRAVGLRKDAKWVSLGISHLSLAMSGVKMFNFYHERTRGRLLMCFQDIGVYRVHQKEVRVNDIQKDCNSWGPPPPYQSICLSLHMALSLSCVTTRGLAAPVNSRDENNFC